MDLLFAAALVFLVFLLLREVTCWYFKFTAITEKLTAIDEKLERIASRASRAA